VITSTEVITEELERTHEAIRKAGKGSHNIEMIQAALRGLGCRTDAAAIAYMRQAVRSGRLSRLVSELEKIDGKAV